MKPLPVSPVHDFPGEKARASLTCTIFCAFLFLLALPAYSQEQPTQAVDSIFEAWNNTDTPGGALAVIQSGEIVYSKGYGMADLEHDIAASPASVFYIASVSKQFVNFCILLLEEEGKLDLDAPIQTYLPDFPDYGAPLTIRNFVHHTSGVRDYLTLMQLKGRSYLDEIDKEEAYELIKSQKALNFTPGERYLYSNSCYFMLALIVEKVSGQSIRDFAHENIFQPLGMNHTLFYDDNTDFVKNRAFSYRKTEEGFDNTILRFDLVGSGGLYSTVEDLYLWDQNYYDNQLGKGGQQIIDKMLTEGTLNNGKSTNYAFGLSVGSYKGLPTVGHGGSLAGYRAYYLRFPEQEFTVVILANRSDASPKTKAYRIADIFLADQLKQEGPLSANVKEVQVDEEITLQDNQITGYYEMKPGLYVEVKTSNGELVVNQNWNRQAFTLERVSGNAFTYENTTIIFTAVEKNKPRKMIYNRDGQGTELTRFERFNPSSSDLERYTGTYYCDEVEARYRITRQDDQLFLQIESRSPIALAPYREGSFIHRGMQLIFDNKQPQVKSFVMDAGRVQGLTFRAINPSVATGSNR